MAIIENNPFMDGASGTFNRQFVLRQRNGKTILCKMPKAYPPKTDTQAANQDRFKKANEYAKAAIADPVIKQFYQDQTTAGQFAYNIALKEAMHGPEVTEVTTKGQTITIQMRDNYVLASVQVMLFDGEGVEQETGDAVLDPNKGQWKYTIQNKGKNKGVRIEATDKLGKTVIWND